MAVTPSASVSGTAHSTRTTKGAAPVESGPCTGDTAVSHPLSDATRLLTAESLLDEYRESERELQDLMQFGPSFSYGRVYGQRPRTVTAPDPHLVDVDG